MKIITKEIEEAFEKQGDTSQKSMSEIKIVMKLFNPLGAGTWYIFEKLDEDTYMGFVNLYDSELAEIGTISMQELMNLKLPLGLSIERDINFKPLSKTLKEVVDIIKSGGYL